MAVVFNSKKGITTTPPSFKFLATSLTKSIAEVLFGFDETL
jgi:hypothetical protein